MNLGLLFLQSVSTGVITNDEMKWITAHQREFSRIDEATALKLQGALEALEYYNPPIADEEPPVEDETETEGT